MAHTPGQALFSEAHRALIAKARRAIRRHRAITACRPKILVLDQIVADEFRRRGISHVEDALIYGHREVAYYAGDAEE